MKRRWVVLISAVWLSGLVWAQQAPDIRNPDIDTQTAEGALIADAAASEDPDEKLQLLETFADKYSEDEAIGFAYLQLQALYLGKQDFTKASEVGEKLLLIVPGDLEVRHNTIKGLEGSQGYDKLLPFLVESKTIAEKEATQPKPEDPDEDEEAAWQGQTEYAQGVVQYIEYSFYTAALRTTDPQLKIGFCDALIEHFPEGQYADKVWESYVSAYQQAGDYVKMAEAMEKALEVNPSNESYLYSVAESYLGKDPAKAQAYGEQLVQVMEQKPMPEGTAEEDWNKQKALFTAYGNFVLGKNLVNQNKFREGRKLLLTSVDPLKEQGGQNYGVLAYYLGICYVKLDIGGDNIAAASRWMGTAATVESPVQAEAKKTLAAIKQAQGQ